MATVPSEMTFVAGSVLTAAQMNSNVRDAVNFVIAPPLAVLRQVSPQSFGTGAWVSVTFDTEDIDRDGGHSNSVNPTRYTAQTAGWYLTQGTCSWAANATGGRQITFGTNGGATKFAKQFQPGNAGFIGSATTDAISYLNVGDYIELFAYQSSGGNLSAVVDSESGPRFELLWVSS